MAEFTIDPEFRDLLDGLRGDERAGLEASIRIDGCRDALVVWAEQSILVDGHNRFAICNDLGKSYRIELKSFASRDEVLLWIIDNQMNRRNVPEARRIAFALKREPIVAAIAKANQLKGGSGKGQEETDNLRIKRSEGAVESKSHGHFTRESIAKAANTSPAQVQRFKEVMAIAPDDIKQKMLSGEMKIGTALAAVKPPRPASVSSELVSEHKEGDVTSNKTSRTKLPVIGWGDVRTKIFDTLSTFVRRYPETRKTVVSEMRNFLKKMENSNVNSNGTEEN